jgi:hypothetical protein
LHGKSFAHADLAACRELASSSLESCDLNSARLDGLRWSRSTFTDTDFRRASMRDFVDRGNAYRHCDFSTSDLRHATIGFDGSKFTDCSFELTRLDGTTFVRPRFVNCAFTGTLRDVDFEASSFERCKFSGRIEGGWFRNGYQHPALIDDFGPPPINTMEKVDFEDAILWGVGFSGKVELSSVLLPRHGEHYFFDRWPDRIQTVAQVDPNRPERPAIDAFLAVFGPSAKNQHQYIVYKGFLVSILGAEGAGHILGLLAGTEHQTAD